MLKLSDEFLDLETYSVKSDPNTDLNVTIPGIWNRNQFVHSLAVAIQGADAGNDVIIQLKENDTVKWEEVIGVGAPPGERLFVSFHNGGLNMGNNTPIQLTISAGGAGVITVANLAVWVN